MTSLLETDDNSIEMQGCTSENSWTGHKISITPEFCGYFPCIPLLFHWNPFTTHDNSTDNCTEHLWFNYLILLNKAIT